MVRTEYVEDPGLADELEKQGWNRPNAPLIDTDDAGRWAHEYMAQWRKAPMRLDENWLEGSMIGWFANALETGKRIGAAQERIRKDREDGEKLLKAVEAEARADVTRDLLLESVHAGVTSPEALVKRLVELQETVRELKSKGVPTATIGDVTITGPDMKQVLEVVEKLARKGGY
jgi:hypothetical protein